MHGLGNAVRIIDRMLLAGLRIFVVAIAAITFSLISYSVFSRFVLNTSIGWAEEAARFMFVWMSLLGWAVVLRERSYAVVELYTLRGPAEEFLAWFLREGLCIAVGIYLLSAGARYAAMTRNVSPALNLDLRLVYSCVAISAGAAILVSLFQTLERLRLVELDNVDTEVTLS